MAANDEGQRLVRVLCEPGTEPSRIAIGFDTLVLSIQARIVPDDLGGLKTPNVDEHKIETLQHCARAQRQPSGQRS